MNGLLLVDKPQGWTSFDVVNKVRRLIQHSEFNTSNKKRFPVGHTGTLDPLATGLLVLLLGAYTRRASELTKLDKTYAVTMRLGQVSTTGDEEGEKSPVSAEQPSLDQLQAILGTFTGEIMQTPPAYSAIKINGQRAYKLAREGKEVIMKARPAHIYSLELTHYAYPSVEFTVEVSSGTYIRSLVEDIGQALGVGAYMSDLRRTQVGDFSLPQALKVGELAAPRIEAALLRL